MPESNLTASELAKLRAMTKADGVAKVSARLGVHRTSVTALLAGEDVRPNTIKVIRMALQEV